MILEYDWRKENEYDRFEFNTGDHKEEEEKVLVGRSYGKEVLYRFRKNKGAWISFFIIILLIVIALAAPAVSPYSYKEVHSEYSNLPPRIPGLEKLGIFDGVSHGRTCMRQKIVLINISFLEQIT